MHRGGRSLIKCLKENETQMLKTDVHVEEKLMQAGNAQSSYQLLFVSFRKGFGPVVGGRLFEGLRGSPYFFSLLHAAHRRNRLSLFNSLNGWCLSHCVVSLAPVYTAPVSLLSSRSSLARFSFRSLEPGLRRRARW